MDVLFEQRRDSWLAPLMLRRVERGEERIRLGEEFAHLALVGMLLGNGNVSHCAALSCYLRHPANAGSETISSLALDSSPGFDPGITRE